MARQFNKLSALDLRSKRKPGRYADGGGLYLQVSRSNTKAWIFRFKFDGRERQMGLGATHAVSLKQAREEATRCRKLVVDSIDPIEARNAEKTRRALEAAQAKTFKDCAEAYMKAMGAEWKNAKHASQWRNTLTTYVYPKFGNLPIQSIDVGMVMDVLEPIWTKKTETAGRVRGRIEKILDWASARTYRVGENPARWRGHLDNLLPKPNKVRKVHHHPALPFDEIGTFIKELRSREGPSAKGLEFLILTATRTNEILGATWDEVDLAKGEWTIPAKRMKSGKAHKIPLSNRAIAILQELGSVENSKFLFAGPNGAMSNMVFLNLLKRMKRNDITAHGFRSTFRDWVAECTAHSREVAEMALAHAIGDKTEEAYRRGDLFEKRRRLMNEWADYCNQPFPEFGSVHTLHLREGA